MIFKYCVWPDAAKDEPHKALINGNGNAVVGVPPSSANSTTPSIILRPPSSCSRKITEGFLGCCPCAFRCRRAIGIDDSPVRVNGDLENGVVINGNVHETTILEIRNEGSANSLRHGYGMFFYVKSI